MVKSGMTDNDPGVNPDPIPDPPSSDPNPEAGTPKPRDERPTLVEALRSLARYILWREESELKAFNDALDRFEEENK